MNHLLLSKQSRFCGTDNKSDKSRGLTWNRRDRCVWVGGQIWIINHWLITIIISGPHRTDWDIPLHQFKITFDVHCLILDPFSHPVWELLTFLLHSSSTQSVYLPRDHCQWLVVEVDFYCYFSICLQTITTQLISQQQQLISSQLSSRWRNCPCEPEEMEWSALFRWNCLLSDCVHSWNHLSVGLASSSSFEKLNDLFIHRSLTRK